MLLPRAIGENQRSVARNNHDIVLSPTQASALNVLSRGLQVGSICAISGEPGSGRTTLLRHLHKEIGGAFLSIADLIDASSKRHPLSLEETFFDVVLAALKQHSTVIVDDFHVLYDALCCNPLYPRTGSIEAPALALAALPIHSRMNLT